MQNWEYCLVQLTYPDTRKAREGRVSIRTKDGSDEYELGGDVEIFDTIERLGQDGWEVVDSSSHLGIIQYIFKRPEQELKQANENLNSLELPPELLHEIIELENELRRKIIESYARVKKNRTNHVVGKVNAQSPNFNR